MVEEEATSEEDSGSGAWQAVGVAARSVVAGEDAAVHFLFWGDLHICRDGGGQCPSTPAT